MKRHNDNPPIMEGCYHEIQTALSTVMHYITVGNFSDFAELQIKRIKALIKHSGIFDQVSPSAGLSFGLAPGERTSENFLKTMYKSLDNIGSMIGKLRPKWLAKQKTTIEDVGEILRRLSDINNIINDGYMYAKTKVDFNGPFNATELYRKEGIE